MSAAESEAPNEVAVTADAGLIDLSPAASEDAGDAPVDASSSLLSTPPASHRKTSSSASSTGSGTSRSIPKTPTGITRPRKISGSDGEPVSPVGSSTSRLSASKLKLPVAGLGATHAKKSSTGSSSSRDTPITPSAPSSLARKKVVASPASSLVEKKNSLPKKGVAGTTSSPSLGTTSRAPSRSPSVSISSSIPLTPTQSSTSSDDTAAATPSPALSRRPSTANPSPAASSVSSSSSVPTAAALAKRRPSAIVKPGVVKSLATSSTASTASTSALRKPSLSSTASASSLHSSGLGSTTVRRPSSAVKRSTPTGSASSTMTASSAEDAEVLVELRASLAQQAEELARAQAELAQMQQENALLRSRLASASAPVSPSNGAPSQFAAQQTARIHELTTSLKNLEQTYQAQREQVEGSMGFAPVAAAGKSVSQSSKDKKFEETIQDLQFQLLYGDTSKDIQLAKLTETHLSSQQAANTDRYELARMKQSLLARKEEQVENWLQKDSLVAVM